MRPSHRRPFPLCLLLVVAAALPPAAAQPSRHPVLSGFLPTGDYMLLIDEEMEPDAQLYLSMRASALLVLSESLGEPVLIWARTMAVDRLARTDLVASAGGWDVTAEPNRSYAGEAGVEEGRIILPLEGRNVRIVPRPPLVGDRTLGELIEHSPEYQVGMDAFEPDGEAMSALHDEGPVEVRVFFGSWCGVCKRVLPNLLQVAAGLEGSNVAFGYYGLDNPPGGWDDPEVDANNVTGLPTAIVFRDGREVGRLTGANDFARPARMLESVLAGTR